MGGMATADVALLVAVALGALLLAATGLAFLRRGEVAPSGLALALIGVLLLGFSVFRSFEVGLGADGGATLKAELKGDIVSVDATVTAEIDGLRMELAALRTQLEARTAGDGGDGGTRAPGSLFPSPPILAAPPGTGAGPAPEPPAVILPAPPPAQALVFHRSARAAEARAIVAALREAGFASAAIASDLSELAASRPERSALIAWTDGHKAEAAEAATLIDAATGGAIAATLREGASTLARGDLQIYLF